MTESAQHSKARIYLAGKRVVTAGDGHCVYQTFSDSSFSAIGRGPFSGIRMLNDEVLKAGVSVTHQSAESSLVLMLPLVGKIKFRVDTDEFRFLEADSSQLMHIGKGSALEISNSYRQESINYLLIWFAAEPVSFEQFAMFDVHKKQNTLIQIFNDSKAAGYIGQFSGRAGFQFSVREPARAVLAFVIEGAFEIEDRLLESRDALTLREVSSVEFEALSNNAIILLIEL